MTAKECRFKKTFAHALILVILTTLATSGCNFFGRKKDEGDGRKTGEISAGQMIVGTYSISAAQPTPNRNPSYAYTETYTFDPNASVRIELKDHHNSGISCVAYGQYRIVGEREVFIYLQAVSPPVCSFAPVIHMSNVQVGNQYLRYEDPTTREGSYLLLRRSVPQVLTGLWDFAGNGGIDYILFDQHGYFLLQITEEEKQYLLIGFYSIEAGHVTLVLFPGMNPSATPYATIPYTFATDGAVLQLTEETENGPVSHFGQRL